MAKYEHIEELSGIGSLMVWLNTLERVELGEDRHSEFKRGPGDLSAIGKAICAFANTDGGVIMLGVDPSHGVVGVKEDVERVQERLTSFLKMGCSSPVTARRGWHEHPKGWVHWIEIPRQRSFEPMCYDGRVWVRRERSNVEPSPSELQELYNAFGYIMTEERPIQAATPEDIDIQCFREYLQAIGLDILGEPQPDNFDDLRNRGVVAQLGDGLHPTLYGVLAFGKEPQRYPQTHGFRIQCVAYEGDDRASNTLQVADVKGRLDEQVQRAVGWFQGLGRFETYRNLFREDRGPLPEAALREALVNAVVHRDYAITGSNVLLEVYDDHVDVTSTGTLPNHMTVERVRAGAHPRSRNESMANNMVVKGLMEKRGRGWPVMRESMFDINGTEPDLFQDDKGGYVRLTFDMRSTEA